MLPIFEIIGTYLVWRRGWRWSALLPLVGVLVVGLALGVVGTLCGVPEPTLLAWGPVLDALALLLLVGMYLCPPARRVNV